MAEPRPAGTRVGGGGIRGRHGRKLLVDRGVDAADEEAGHRRDAGDGLAGRRAVFEAGDERFDDAGVALVAYDWRLASGSTGTLNTKTLIFVPVSTPSTVAELQILGSTAGSNLSADKINITGDLTLNSLSNIFVNGSGYTAAVGDSFTVIDWSGVLTIGGFSTGTNLRTGANAAGNEGNLDLPDITGIGFWDISDLAGSGALTLTVVVPEPARGMLLLLGLASLIFRRRKING